MDSFDWGIVSGEDFEQAKTLLNGDMREPDLIIAPDGNPYLYRWHLQRNFHNGGGCGSNLHIQVASDPERPLHTHPWDNMSVILGGAGYEEWLQKIPPHGDTMVYKRRKGDVIFRRAHEAHRLIMPEGGLYTMTQFTFGPKINHWGFWYPDEFRPYETVTLMVGNKSVHVKDSDAQRQTNEGPGACALRPGLDSSNDGPMTATELEELQDRLNDAKGG